MQAQQCRVCREIGVWRGTGTVHRMMRDFWACLGCERAWDTPHDLTVHLVAQLSLPPAPE